MGMYLLVLALIVAGWFLWRRLPSRSVAATVRIRRKAGAGYVVEMIDTLSGADRNRLKDFAEEMDWAGPVTFRIVRGEGGRAKVFFHGRISESHRQRVRNFVVNCLNVK